MAQARLQLTDSDLLRKLMQWAPGGTPLTVRALASQVGVSKSKISALLSGDRVTVEPPVAQRIAVAVGVHERALFFEPLSTPMGVDTPCSHPQEGLQ